MGVTKGVKKRVKLKLIASLHLVLWECEKEGENVADKALMYVVGVVLVRYFAILYY